jgi:hypothetical protein
MVVFQSLGFNRYLLEDLLPKFNVILPIIDRMACYFHFQFFKERILKYSRWSTFIHFGAAKV